MLEPQTASGKAATEECLICDSTAARGCPCPQMLDQPPHSQFMMTEMT